MEDDAPSLLPENTKHLGGRACGAMWTGAPLPRSPRGHRDRFAAQPSKERGQPRTIDGEGRNRRRERLSARAASSTGRRTQPALCNMSGLDPKTNSLLYVPNQLTRSSTVLCRCLSCHLRAIGNLRSRGPTRTGNVEAASDRAQGASRRGRAPVSLMRGVSSSTRASRRTSRCVWSRRSPHCAPRRPIARSVRRYKSRRSINSGCGSAISVCSAIIST